MYNTKYCITKFDDQCLLSLPETSNQGKKGERESGLGSKRSECLLLDRLQANNFIIYMHNLHNINYNDKL